jgi:hypothetical protein
MQILLTESEANLLIELLEIAVFSRTRLSKKQALLAEQFLINTLKIPADYYAFTGLFGSNGDQPLKPLVTKLDVKSDECNQIAVIIKSLLQSDYQSRFIIEKVTLLEKFERTI